MSLLNAALAFGAFAFTIPLIIHLFFRSRFKTVDWGAMYLLESVVRVNRRRMQVTNLLLLLLRCAIPVLLAFCLARPVWTGLRALAGDAPKTLVIAIDDSRSMSLTPPGEPSRIEVAKQELRTVLADLTRRDEVMLVRGSRLGAVPSKMGVSDALAGLRKIDAQGNAVSIGQLVDAAIAAADEGSHPRRQILVVSDFQAGAVDTATLEAARRIAETNKIEAESDRGNRLVIDMLDVGTHWDDLANVSVDAVTIDSPVIVSERSGVYTATLRNASDLPANDLRLIWSIDGKPLEPRVVSIDAKSTSTNRLTHTIDQAGIHEVAATIDRGDVLVEDNTRSVAVEVINEVNVLLVDGRPGNE
ncbi:BatA domain-containing protein, partial [Stieleria sp.]|uniref:BatA domain-containing protein n=1 Tax=Stieleria sp. TaxID=2795976 RepID=UPI0035688999